MLQIKLNAVLVFILLAVTCAHAGEPDRIVEQLKNGGVVLMIRHANAPGGGDPPHFEIGDCTTQRNLDDLGRVQARHIGRWFKNRGLLSASVYSSQWCRCLETARLMELGPVVELPALNSFFNRPRDRESNLNALREFLSRLSTNTGPVILVTHYVTISGMTGLHVSSGEAVALRILGSKGYEVIGRLDFDL